MANLNATQHGHKQVFNIVAVEAPPYPFWLIGRSDHSVVARGGPGGTPGMTLKPSVSWRPKGGSVILQSREHCLKVNSITLASYHLSH